MSYNKRVWANGDLITKERMNNIENGIKNLDDKINSLNLENSYSQSEIKSLLDYSSLVIDDDWTNAFKQVAQDIGVDYNVLYIPYGTYNITEVIWIENKNNISILSDFATIKNTVQDNGSSKAGTFYFRYCEGVYLDKVIHQGIDSQKPITSLNGGRYGLMFHGCSNIYVHQNHFYDFADNALLVGRESNTDTEKVHGCKYVYVDSCVFDNIWQTSTTTMGCEDYHFINNKVRNIYGSCKFAQRYDLGGQLYIMNNHIEGAIDFSNDTTKVSKGFEINNYKNIIISGNIIRKMSNGIWLANNGRADDERYTLIENVTISSNVIDTFNNYGISVYHTPITLTDGTKGIWKNITIENNTIKNSTSSQAAIYVRGEEVVGLTISDNTVDTLNSNIYIVSTKSKDDTDNFIYPNNYYNIIGNRLICTGSTQRNIIFAPSTYAPYAMISGNICDSYAGENILINTTSDYIENVLIDSNVFNEFGNYANIQHNFVKSTISNNIFNNSSSNGININYNTFVIWCKVINNRFNTSNHGIRTTGEGTLYVWANAFNSKTINHTGTVVTVDYLPDIPSKTSELTNDSNYVTVNEMADAINSASLGETIDPVVPVTYEWEQGGVSSTGELRDATNRIRTVNYITFDKKTTFESKNPNYVLRWYKYDTNQTFVQESGVWETKVEFEASTDYVYRVAIRNSSDANITTDVASYFDVYTGTKTSTDTGSVVSFYNDYPALFVPYKFKLEAHRGYSDKYPENTTLAFEEAGKLDIYTGIETDVHRTSDGVFILMHDSTIDRTTNGTGKPSAYTYAQLQEFYIDGGNGWDSKYANQLKIPKLTEYLEICRKYNKIPYIQVDQVDSSYLGELIELLDKEGWKGRCVLTSFTFADLAAVRAITDEYVFEYMISVSTADSAYTNALSALTGYKNVVFRPDAVSFLGKSNAQDFIYKFREAGILVECYGLPVGDTTTLTKMLKLGIEGCTCNSYVGFEGILGGATSSASVGVAKDLTIEDAAGNFTATNVEDALAELFQFVSNGKSLIASAITDMGVATSNIDSFQTMADNIRAISGGTQVITYTITNNLTNCTTNNTSESIIANKSYVAELSSNDGYTLDAVTVTMSGADITETAYTNEITYEWEVGGLGSSGNFNNTAKNRIRTTEYKTITSTTTFTGRNNYQVWWYRFNASDHSFVDSAGAWGESYTLEPNDSYVYYIAIRHSGNGNIGVDVASNVTITTAEGHVNIPSVTGNVVITANANANA